MEGSSSPVFEPGHQLKNRFFFRTRCATSAGVQALLLAITVVSAASLVVFMTLPMLVERARENDHRVKEAQAQLRFYRSKYDEAWWAWFPKIESYVAVAGPTPEARNNGLGGPPTTSSSLMYDLDFGNPGAMFRAEASAVLPIYTFGKLTALQKAGKKGIEAGQALTNSAKDEAEYQVSQAYWGYCVANSGKQVIADTLGRLEDAAKVLERLRASGSEQVTQMDLYKIDYYRRQAEVQIAAAESGANFALEAIRLLIAAEPDEEFSVVMVPLEAPEGSLLPVDSYLSTAKSFRPELFAIEAGISAREQEVALRQAMYWPDFGIAGFAKWVWTTNTTRQRSPFAYDPFNALEAGFALVGKYTFDFPQKSIALEQAQAELQKMQHQRDLLVAAVRLEIEKQWNDSNAAIAKGEKLTSAEKSAKKWATAAFTAFDLGTSDTRELVDSFSALATASAQRVQAFHDAHVGIAALRRATGHLVELIPRSAALPPPPSALVPKAH
jgi:outer membrane protein TolC